jgi:hypothetical protein
MVSRPTDDDSRSAAEREGDDSAADSPAGGADAGDDQHDETTAESAGDERETRSAPRRDSDERTDQIRAQILDCIENPGESASRLPYLLSYLESEDQTVRWLAASACCLIAVESDDDEVVEYLVRRMTDRLTEEGISLELTTALDYLSSTFTAQVGPLLAEMADEESELTVPEVGDFTRSYYYGQEFDRSGVGRLQIAGENAEENPHHVVADRQREEREQIEYERRRREQDDDEDGEEGADETDEEPTAEQLAGNSATMVQESAAVSTIADQSRFDELYIRGERSRGRYATTYEALVGVGGEQRAVALRLLHQPDPRDVIPTFARDLADQLGRWEAASDHESVVTVFDWGVEARAWVATELFEELLVERDRPPVSVAFEYAIALADAVSHLHQNDVIHGGIDPQTVAFPAEQFDEADDVDAQPLLNNVGLINVFRYYFEPADCLDPRFAAPEYYDDRFGRVDHATDIYQLGAVCYLLFTGRPLFSGEFETIRERVLTHRPSPPSTVADEVPPKLDEILAKTTAKQKLRRYETVEQFRSELASLAEAFV